jgi:hypothetical protein
MFAALNSFLTGALAKVTDVYWPFVSMLLHGDGVNGGQNNTFLDTSTNNFTVTRNGNTTQGSFNPFVSTYPYSVATNGGSGYFDGTGDYLTVPDNAAFNLAANDFTIECWVYLTTIANTPIIAAQTNTLKSVMSFFIYITPTGSIGTEIQTTGSFYRGIYSTVGTIVTNTWYHVAFVRNGNTNRQYINGVQTGTISVTGDIVRDSADVVSIGAKNISSSQDTTGYISNFRLVNGTCLYPSGTTFTPPTAPLTAVTNTALLLGMSNAAIFDNAILNNLETVASAQISTSVFKYGTGSMKFNGAGDVLVIPNKAAIRLGGFRSPFTMECWIYPTATPTGSVGYIVGDWVTGAASGPSNYAWYADGTNITFYGVSYGNSYYDAGGIVLAGGAYSNNVWTHIAVCYDGTTLRTFLNGSVVASGAWTGLSTNLGSYAANVGIGNVATAPTGYGYIGYIDDLRLTRNIARYTATFTPPTSAFPNLGPTTYPVGWATQRAMFAFGVSSSALSTTNLVSNTGIVAGDASTVATARQGLAAAGYGGDKAIFAYGYTTGVVSLSNLVSNTGVIAADTTGVGTARYLINAASYGTGQAIFAYGYTSTQVSISNLVSSAGVIATDTTGVGTTRSQLAAASYGTDKAIFAYGWAGPVVSVSNLVSNTGVVGNDVTGVGTARLGPAAAGYGGDKAIFGYGNNSSAVNSPVSMTNLASNTGVIASDTTGVGTARAYIAAASYGGDKAIFGYGYNGSNLSMSNVVTNTGVVATDTTGVGTARSNNYGVNYSYSP